MLPTRQHTPFRGQQRLAALLCCSLLAHAGESLLTPSIGSIVLADGTERAVYGLPGAFTLGELGAVTTSLAPRAGNSLHIVQRGEDFLIVTETDSVIDMLPRDAEAPVLLLDTATLYSTGTHLVIRRGGIDAIRLDCPSVTSLRVMSSDSLATWVQVSTAGREFVLRLLANRAEHSTSGEAALFLLPAPNPTDASTDAASPRTGARRR